MFGGASNDGPFNDVHFFDLGVCMKFSRCHLIP
jgi:hypothetical protein